MIPLLALALALLAQQPQITRHGAPAPAATVEAVPFTAVDPGTRPKDATFTVTSSPFIPPSDRYSDDPRLSRYDHRVRAALQLDPAGWVDTHIVVIPGDRINITATGSIALPDGRTATPDGVPRNWKDLLRLFPLSTANTGALIARVGNTDVPVPFALGAFKEVVVHQAGELLLRINLSEDLETKGSYRVNLHFDAEGTAETAATPSIALDPNTFTRLPRRVTDHAGRPGDMVNFALLGSRQQVLDAFKAAGWVQVDKTKKHAIIHGVETTMDKQPYLELPMSLLYLYGRPQDMSYARANPLAVAAVRHHLRLWDTGIQVNGIELWAGAATHDIGIERNENNHLLTHRIAADVDQERDYVLATLQAAGVADSAAYVTPGNPLRESRNATGDSFYSDGRIAVIGLR